MYVLEALIENFPRLFTMTLNTSSKINILILLVCMLPAAARRPFSQHKKVDSEPKTVVQHPLAEANHRNLQTDEEVCEFLLNEGFSEEDRLFCSCDRVGDIYQVECRYTECLDCEILQGVDTCAALIEGVVLDAATLSEELFISCVDYESGLFNSTICVFEREENGSDNCTVTADNVPCNSCAFATCDDGFENYNVDCSNVPGGAVWNFCNADIPETSPFVAFGDNEIFFFDRCFDLSSNSTFPGPTASPQTAPPTSSPTAPPTAPPTASPQTALPTAAPETAPPTASPQTALPTAAPQTAPQTAPPTASPQTSSPTTSPGTAQPVVAASSMVPVTTSAPTNTRVNSDPTAAPVNTGTPVSTSAPDVAVTAMPSMVPMTTETMTPSRASRAPGSTVAPSRTPVSTTSPSRNPVTVSPSRAPVTVVPSRAPVTASPSNAPSMGPSTQPFTAVPSTTPAMGDPTAPSPSSIPDENRSQPSGGFSLSVHTLLLVVSAAFVATFC
jgi:hypothetical protein